MVPRPRGVVLFAEDEMAVRIRLARFGTKNRPYYRVVAIDSQSKRNGRCLEQLGTYDPLANPPEVRLEAERIQYWVGTGATPSDTVRSLINRHIKK